jgi:cobalt-zinc-cadmium efflux system membrane fusion protein
LIPKRSSHSTEALITENNKNFVLFLKKKTTLISFKKVAVKIGEKSESMLKLFQVTKLTLARKF